MKRKARVFKFFLLNVVGLPIALLLLKLLVRTYRVDPRSVEELREILRTRERLAILIWHGVLLSIMPLARYGPAEKREVCIMTSPSRDGRFLDRIVAAFGMRSIKGSSRSRAVAGTREMINAMRGGAVGLIALDGPRGPRLEPKSGAISIARSAESSVLCLSAGTRHAIRFRSWDRLFLPLPFARLEFHLREYPLPEHNGKPVQEIAGEVGDLMRDDSRAVSCPILEEKG